MKEEKYVSIEYDTWHSKYLPMEQELEKIRQELRKEKQSKICYLNINTQTFSLAGYPEYKDLEVGTVDYSLSNFSKIEIKEKEILSFIEERIAKYYGSFTRLATSNDLKAHNKRVNDVLQKVVVIQDKLNEKIKSIPRIVRWLFKISL